MKKIYKFLFAFLFSVAIWVLMFYSCQAQINGTFKSVRFVNADSTSIISGGLGNFQGSGGIIYYNEDQNKFRAYQDSTWVDLIGSGGGGGGDFWELSGAQMLQGDYSLDLFTNTLSFGGFGSSFNVVGPDFNTASPNVSYITDNFQVSTFFPDSFAGIQYGDDYSSNYTNRSLVDKEYVDNAVSGGGGAFWPLSGSFSTTSPQAVNIGGNLSFIGGAGESIVLQSNNAASTLSLQANSAGLVSTGSANIELQSANDLNINTVNIDGDVSNTMHYVIDDSLLFESDDLTQKRLISMTTSGIRLQALGSQDSIVLDAYRNGSLGRINLNATNIINFKANNEQAFRIQSGAVTSDKDFIVQGDLVTFANPKLRHALYTGSLTDGAPTNAEINAIITSPQDGERGVIRDTDGTGNLYNVVYTTTGSQWYYTEMTAAP